MVYNIPVHRLVGIETEYGLYVEGRSVSDQMGDAVSFVRSCPFPAVKKWDYRLEDPRRDMRGFRVEQLAVDPKDAEIERAHPISLSEQEARADHVLTNGARFYNDHAHPEYATPECLGLLDLVAHEKAGERIVLATAHAFTKNTGMVAHLYKNNTDHHGSSYGCHESYLLMRAVPFDALALAMVPFLTTRLLYAGAGKVGVEGPPYPRVPYQIAQRADFYTDVMNVETLYKRPIFNTRDEPHATPRAYRRLHVICGDANMSEYATALKVGTTALVLDLVEAGWLPTWVVKDPVRTAHQLSRDPDGKWLVETDSGTISAIDLQRGYLQEAQRQLSGRDAETDWLLREWEVVLNALETEPETLADRIDWIAKRQLLELYRESEGLAWDDSALFALDLEYHHVDPDRGLYHALVEQGTMRTLISEEAIALAVVRPPDDTRAWIRGLCVERFAEHVQSLNWEQMILRSEAQIVRLDLSRLVGNLKPLNRRLTEVDTITTFVQKVQEASHDVAS
ncbi:MAG: peptidase [Armatimonadota bacterium]